MSCDLKFKTRRIYIFSGQATDVSINTNLKTKKRPFTFTSLNDNDYLEFIIKIYDSNDGVTRELGKSKVMNFYP
jgi:hypothetical protein